MAQTKHRHKPIEGSRRAGWLVPQTGKGHLPQIYLSETPAAIDGVYQSDHPDQRGGSRFRWFVSTILAAGVGVLAIGGAVFGSMDREKGEASLIGVIQRVMSQSMVAPNTAGLNGLATPDGRSDRLAAAVRGSTTMQIIQDKVQERRNGKDFIAIKPYARIVARLASASTASPELIPPFNPFTLYVNAAGTSNSAETGAQASGTVSVSLRDPDGGGLPNQDGLEFRPEEVAQIVVADRDAAAADATMQDGGSSADAGDSDTVPAAAARAASAEPLPVNTVAIGKTAVENASLPEAEGQEVRVVQAGDHETLTRVLIRNDVEPELAHAVVAAALKVVDGEGLLADQEVRLVLAPANNDKLAPVLVSVFDQGHSHLVTISRLPGGTYAGSDDPGAANLQGQLEQTEDKSQHTSLYASFYGSALSQGLPADMITRMIRTFAHDTDFRRRIGPGDGYEAFYDIVGDEKSGHGALHGHPDQLLYAALTVGGETRRFYRFRTPDGVVDYYDVQGNNAQKFLNLKPVRGDVRFSSGFGFRLHPLLHIKKMHTGIDWAGTVGTPILAAGSGTIEEMKYKGGNGNYIRILHANGYETAYSHMLKFAKGISAGSKVNQGDLIGYIGNTGLSTGAHLHFEVLINATFVDPMAVRVPRDRQLTGRLLVDFQKERAHIEELMNRAPVATLVDQGRTNG